MSVENWTIKNIPELKGKIIIVTGGNSGLGLESVKAFSEKGAEVILACRSVEKGEEAKSNIEKSKMTGKIVVMKLDLMDLASIINFATKFKENFNRLDVLLNNAGIMTTPYFLTKDGFEGQMGTNHLGHFVLAASLFDLIKSTPKARIVNISSAAHKQGKMDFDNLLFENAKDYSPLKSYGRSKLSNLLFTYELQRRIAANGIDAISVAAHPGVAQTNLARHLEGKWWFNLLTPIFKMISQDQASGALPGIRASVDSAVKGGEYYGPHKGMKGFPIVVTSNEASHNLEDARKLWDASEKLTHVKFNFEI